MAGKASKPSDMLHRLASSPAPIERPAPEVEVTLTEAQTTRLSVDLDDAQFEFLTVYAMRRKVSKVDVMRALMAELQVSTDLAERVSERLPKRRRK
jgi:hypothetical protein